MPTWESKWGFFTIFSSYLTCEKKIKYKMYVHCTPYPRRSTYRFLKRQVHLDTLEGRLIGPLRGKYNNKPYRHGSGP